MAILRPAHDDRDGAGMSFFGNGAVNRVNLHTTIFAFAMGAGGIFFTAVMLACLCRWRWWLRPPRS